MFPVPTFDLIPGSERKHTSVSWMLGAYLLMGLLCFIPTYSSHAQAILIFGDSVSAGYGMTPEESWPTLLADDFKQTHPQFRVINASVSGETTSGGLTRFNKALDVHQPALVILELGGNDGLRGYPIKRIEANLRAMIAHAHNRSIPVILVGIVLPPNYGRRYTTAFKTIFQDLANELSLAGFLPHPLQGLETDPALIQSDGIHPTAEAQPIIKNQIKPLIMHWFDQR